MGHTDIVEHQPVRPVGRQHVHVDDGRFVQVDVRKSVRMVMALHGSNNGRQGLRKGRADLESLQVPRGPGAFHASDLAIRTRGQDQVSVIAQYLGQYIRGCIC